LRRPHDTGDRGWRGRTSAGPYTLQGIAPDLHRVQGHHGPGKRGVGGPCRRPQASQPHEHPTAVQVQHRVGAVVADGAPRTLAANRHRVSDTALLLLPPVIDKAPPPKSRSAAEAPARVAQAVLFSNTTSSKAASAPASRGPHTMATPPPPTAPTSAGSSSAASADTVTITRPFMMASPDKARLSLDSNALSVPWQSSAVAPDPAPTTRRGRVAQAPQLVAV
jgi:hypothetical protein